MLNFIRRLQNIRLVKKDKYAFLKDRLKDADAFSFLQEIPKDRVLQSLALIDQSKAQLRQDLFVLSELDFKKEGFFVEFGATNGFDLSNTFLLEKQFDWNGIVAEPSKAWHDKLRQNRSCYIEEMCVWKNSGDLLTFNEVHRGELSTIASYSNSDAHRNRRARGRKYEVQTISLLDMLKKYDAPRCIDYLSVDTEGSELEILKAFDFSEYSFRVITVEHNYTTNRQKIFELLSSNGYKRKYETISQFDDWYVLSR